MKILSEAGHKTVPCSVINIAKEKEPLLNIALNNPPGKWDYPKLKDLLIEIDTGEFDIELTGFDELELKKIFDYKKETSDFDFKEEISVDDSRENIECPKCGFKWQK